MVDWHVTVREIGPRLKRYFLAILPSPMAADSVQETLIRLVQKCESGEYDPTKGSLAMYAFCIAHYVRHELARSTPPEEALSQFTHSEASEEFENAMEQNSQRQMLRRGI